ncbi:MAG: sulfatase [Planctomycetota bacterium]
MSSSSERRHLRGRQLLFFLWLVVLCVAVVAFLHRGGPRRNVVVILLDTVRADRLGCYGSSLGLTPAMDSLARDSVRFENAFAHAPWTLPSVASLLTSQLPAQHRAGGRLGQFRPLPESAVTLAEHFRDAGAATCAITNVLFLTEAFGMTQGFDSVDAYADATNVRMRRAGLTTELALRWLDERPDGPFLLLVHYFDPHLIYDPLQPFRKEFADPRDQEKSPKPLFGTREDMLNFRRGSAQLEPDTIGRLEKLYNGEIAYLDSQVGRLLAGLELRGLDSETIVLLTADHGEEFLDHGGFEHGHTLYRELLHVPLILRAGGESQVITATVGLMDVAPTLCELAGIPTAPEFSGKSLVPFLDGEETRDRPVLAEGNMWGESGQAWRNGSYTLIRQPTVRRPQLFDTRADPKEQTDLSAEQSSQRDRMLLDLDLILRFLKPTPSPPLSNEELARLRALGY